MDHTESESNGGGEMEILHFSHQHPLVFIQDESFASEAAHCFGCDRSLQGPRYGCKECMYFLHKKCAELELTSEIDHPFHPPHPLTLLPKSPYRCRYECDFCNGISEGFVYHCASCLFDLHVTCALLQSSIAANFPTCLHQHSLVFVQNHTRELKQDCSACKNPLSGPIYHCTNCSFPDFFNLHEKCANLSLEVKHPYDPDHPLTLSPEPTAHPHNCSCYLCKIQWEGFVYSCSPCNFELTIDEYFAPQTIKIQIHEHSWTRILRKMSFTCDFCGTIGDHTPYLCTTCDLVVHKMCIPMPRKIMITRHPHVLSHSYSLQKDRFEDWMCKICYEEVNRRYGSYSCSDTDCNYIAHVHCATNKAIWDGTIVLEDDDESCKGMKNESLNLITEVVEQKSIGEQMVATEIKHEYHGHNLRLTFSGDIEDDSQCDGCMRPISTPFFSCGECKFFLHKDCAELPREKRHPFHKHFLVLTNSYSEDGYSVCGACRRPYQGFSYRCYNDNCRSFFYCDVRCISLLDTLKHPSHEHSLFLAHNFPTKCSGCRDEISRDDLAYKCMKHCGFTSDIWCVTQPLTACYKYDRHPLTLTYSDDSSPSQHYCDLCENERDPNDWFYYCVDCDNSLHSECALRDPRFMKLGSKVMYASHQHPLTVVKNIWNCPPLHGFSYQCEKEECGSFFRCDIRCVSVSDTLKHPSHEHSLFLVHDFPTKCCGCLEVIFEDGIAYRCMKRCDFTLDIRCATLPHAARYKYDKHPLTLTYSDDSSPSQHYCDLCENERHHHIISHSYSLPQNEVGDWMCRICHEDVDTRYGSYYRSASDRDYIARVHCATNEETWDGRNMVAIEIKHGCHDHNLRLVFSGEIEDDDSYCDGCMRLISTAFYSYRFEDWMCKICYEKVNRRYGSYSCSNTDCNYIAHVHCATNKAIWDGTIVLEDDGESCKETKNESLNLITEVVAQKCIGEQMVATEIKHEYHGHNLRLTFSGDIEDDRQCDGCVRPISAPFYGCDECKFFLHKDCAELPREKRHPFHKHLLMLTNSYIDVDYTLKHPSHEHALFLAHNFPTKCSGCRYEISRDDLAYRCMKHCGFTLDLECVTKPLTAWYKYDRHPLTLTCSDDSSPSQHYCDLCENERDPNDWFYYCVDCDNSLHSKCALRDPRFMKLGRKVEDDKHPHPLTVVKNIWNCLPCDICSNPCNGVALECKDYDCNFLVHLWCL
ncbi:hypothetical protein GQ457_17G001680 [Hibiscus cannabinus]